MDYKKIHDLIIARAQSENRTKLPKEDPNYVYYELHHIIPDCFYIINRSKGKRPGWLEGDANASENLVLLTGREHFVVHQLLVHIYTEHRYLLIQGVHKMTSFNCDQDGRSRNKVYSWIRELHATSMSLQRKGKTYDEMHGEEKSIALKKKISVSGKGRIFSNDHKKKIGDAQRGRKKSEAQVAKMKLAMKGKGDGTKNNFYGKTHSDETKRKLSALRKGMVVVKDANTNEIIGSVSKDHPKYISKEWVSIRTGSTRSLEAKEKTKNTMLSKEWAFEKSSKKVLCIETNKTYRSLKSAADDIGCQPFTISQCAQGIIPSVKGYTWKFVNNYPTN